MIYHSTTSELPALSRISDGGADDVRMCCDPERFCGVTADKVYLSKISDWKRC